MKIFTLVLMALLLSVSASGEPHRKRQNNISKPNELVNFFSDHKQAGEIERFLSTNKWLYAKFSALKNSYTHKLDSLLTMGLDVTTEILEKEYLDVFVYDEAWRATSIIEKEWMSHAGEGAWEIWGQTEITYNDAGLVEWLIDYDVDDDGSLVAESKIEIYYDETNRVDYIYMYSTESNKTWYLTVKQYFHYNDSGTLAKVIMEYFDDDYQEWVEYMEILYTYDASGRRDSMGMYLFIEDDDDDDDWDKTEGDWLLWSLTNYFYNSAGQLIRSETESFSPASFTLQPSDKTEYTYDSDGDVSSITEYVWDEWGKKTWIPDYQDDYTYLSNLNFADVAYPYAAYATIYASMDEIPDEFKKAIDEVYGHSYIDGDFILTEKEIYYYSPTTDTPDEYTLSYFAGSNGQVIGQTTQTVPHGGSGTEVEAVPDQGYHFTEWSDGVKTPKRTDTNVTSNITATAFFAANTYTITAEPNNAAYGSVSGAGSYDHGDAVSLKATPNEGYHFVHWSENAEVISADQVLTFTATENRTLTAVFAINTYTITASINNAAYGTITGAGEYDHGQTATLVAASTNAAIYVFVNWTENGNVLHEAAEYSFTVTENRNLTAHFQNVTTVNKIAHLPTINTYPNPARHSLMVESPVIIKNITVYDTSGQQLVFVVVNDNHHELNVSSLRTGGYIMKATTTEGSVTSRFLIE